MKHYEWYSENEITPSVRTLPANNMFFYKALFVIFSLNIYNVNLGENSY